MAKKTSELIVTEGRLSERVALELLISRCDDMTIGNAKALARDMSTQIRNTIYEIDKRGLKITDTQANSEMFWIDAIRNSGCDFNQKP